MIRLSTIIRWATGQKNTLQLKGHSGELRSEVYQMNHAGIVSCPSEGYGYLIYFDGHSPKPHFMPHGDPTKIPKCMPGETIIYNPDTGENIIKIDDEGIKITGNIILEGNVSVEGSLNLTRNNGSSGPVSIDGDVDTDGDSIISPS